MTVAVAVTVATVFLTTACASGSADRASPARDASPGASLAPPDSAPSTSTSVSAAPETTTAAEKPEPGSITPIDDAVAARMTASWRAGCPVPLEALRLVSVRHWSFDGTIQKGEIVVAAEHAAATVSLFETLLDAKFPIAQVRLVDEFGGDDDRSMAANNTSAFNCRRATGSGRWSEHAYGAAIDINPIQNPFVTTAGRVVPPEGASYVERDSSEPGLIVAGGDVVAAFDSIGWKWGGEWARSKDYQHFSASGR